MCNAPLEHLSSGAVASLGPAPQSASRTDVYRAFPQSCVGFARSPSPSRTLSERIDLCRLCFAVLTSWPGTSPGLGLNAGERIAVLSRNRREYVEVQLAAAATGLIVACLNWRLLAAELRHCVTLVSPRLIISRTRSARVARPDPGYRDTGPGPRIRGRPDAGLPIHPRPTRPRKRAGHSVYQRHHRPAQGGSPQPSRDDCPRDMTFAAELGLCPERTHLSPGRRCSTWPRPITLCPRFCAVAPW